MVTILSAVVLLGILIFVHELGHFSLAKLLGVRVERFSLGFPPKMIGKKLGETEYMISWIPLGGYVKMFGENPDEEGSVPPGEEHRSFSHKPTWARFLIVFAGPAFNFLFALVVFWAIISWQGVEHFPPVIGKVATGGPAAAAGLLPGDVLTSINGQKINYFSGIDEQVRNSDGRTLNITLQRDGKQLAISVTPKKSTEKNIFGEEVPRYEIGIDPHLSAHVGGLQPGMPADAAGIEVGDRIVSIQGKPISDWYDLLDSIHESNGHEITVTVERDGKKFSLAMTPKMVRNDGADPTGKVEWTPMIGIERRDDTLTEKVGIFSAVYYAGGRVWELSRLTVVSVVKLIQRKLSVKTLGGPIFIAELAGKQARAGFLSFISLGALLSLNLGILNLLPIPVLDGGHLFFYVIEMIFRRPISLRIRERAQQVGMVFLIMFMAFVFYNDIARLVTRTQGTELAPTEEIHQSVEPTKQVHPAVIVLALETSTLIGGVALVRDDQVIAQARTDEGVTHSRTILPEIKRLLDESGLSVSDIDLFAVGVGPGSFTGLRIGLAAAKGLAWAAGKPLVGVSSLDAMAHAMPLSSDQVCPLIIARKDLMFAALYESAHHGYTRRTDYMSTSPARLAETIDRPTTFFGKGPAGWEEELLKLLGDRFRRGPLELDHPRARDVARLGAERLAQGDLADPALVTPMYIRPPDIWPMKGSFGAGLGRFARPPGEAV